MARVTWCGKDFTSAAEESFKKGLNILLAKPVYTANTLPPTFLKQLQASKDPQSILANKTELFLSHGNEFKPLVTRVVKRFDVFLYYGYNPKREETHTLPASCTTDYFIRFIVDSEISSPRVLIVSNPHRAELELEQYGREHFECFFAKSMISLPFRMFIDKFGAYRNIYRSILGIYALPAFYSDKVNNLRSSVTPLALGPFGADETQVLRMLTYLRELGRGCDINLGNGSTVSVCSFTVCFVTIMPQQAELTGCLNFKGKRGCRDCLIPSISRSDLQYDIVLNGRYHHHMQHFRKTVNGLKATERKAKLRNVGLSEKDDLLVSDQVFTPALDIFRSRPTDTAYSKNANLVKYCQKILINVLLTPKHHPGFLHHFQRFPLPPGWKPIQNPVTHMDSGRMMEAGQASVLIPVILQHTLDNKFMRPEILAVIKSHARQFLGDIPDDFSASDMIILAFWNIAKSNMQVYGRQPLIVSRSEFFSTVLLGRKSMQFLFHIAATKTSRKSGALESSQIRQYRNRPLNTPADLASQVSTVGQDTIGIGSFGSATNFTAASVEDTDPERYEKGVKANAYIVLKGLPNIHASLHL
ncbi:hypothetical protein H9Q74_007482 [Fusarium xylarioides]|nr:hypothetical protein H9Q71_007701 [Fusarium xylarioides]KAG5822412.1 hypothetical protein H9Q74_007482 [Fusarium xylarioides]